MNDRTVWILAGVLMLQVALFVVGRRLQGDAPDWRLRCLGCGSTRPARRGWRWNGPRVG